MAAASTTVVVYQYPKCSTCRKAIKWLDAQGVAYRSVDIVSEPPSVAVLEQVRRVAGVELKKLFNTSGQSYRNGGWKDKLPSTSEADAYVALASDGKLIKRPMVVGDDVALIGFREAEWAEALG
ncbi:arsenate reductase [Plesiocystis pacifica SIR-1]|uniref:Arsenate reductase n=1 Tax=Plesiocystis pacifica SIR-1 TaxID=391625 RepID=A6FYV3_9BACT|nr:arsenate reductase family protein [Plesiocystis pacifica]EDM81108.1 arsenate reductase [Plesiocystis pacifica SIR-1]